MVDGTEIRNYINVKAIAGFPDETFDVAMDTVELCRQIEGWDDCNTSIF